MREEPFSWESSAICPSSCVDCSNVLYSKIQRNFRNSGGIGVVWLCLVGLWYVFVLVGLRWSISWALLALLGHLVINATVVAEGSGYMYKCRSLQLYMQLFLHAVQHHSIPLNISGVGVWV